MSFPFPKLSSKAKDLLAQTVAITTGYDRNKEQNQNRYRNECTNESNTTTTPPYCHLRETHCNHSTQTPSLLPPCFQTFTPSLPTP